MTAVLAKYWATAAFGGTAAVAAALLLVTGAPWPLGWVFSGMFVGDSIYLAVAARRDTALRLVGKATVDLVGAAAIALAFLYEDDATTALVGALTCVTFVLLFGSLWLRYARPTRAIA